MVLYYCDCDCGYDPVLVLDLFLYIIWLRLEVSNRLCINRLHNDQLTNIQGSAVLP